MSHSFCLISGLKLLMLDDLFLIVVSALKQEGYPNLSLDGQFPVDLDYEGAHIKRDIPGELSGKVVRNFCNYHISKFGEGRAKKSRQIVMAKWVAPALRVAYPYGHYPRYPETLPGALEADIIECRGRRVILESDLQAWCTVIAEAKYSDPLESE